MRCVADRDYQVDRYSDRAGGDIRGLRCSYCEFYIRKRSTPMPKGSRSGLGRYNRMRAWMVEHLHEKHREKLGVTSARGAA